MILVSFDLSFFTSIPGMLITGGVLLLLIALVIFIATGSKKNKKENKEVVDNNSIVNSTPAVNVNVTPAEAVQQMNNMNQVNSDFVQPTVEAAVPVNNVIEMPAVVEPVASTVSENTMSFIPNDISVQPAVEPVAQEFVAPTVPVQEEVVPVVETVVTPEVNVEPVMEIPVGPVENVSINSGVVMQPTNDSVVVTPEDSVEPTVEAVVAPEIVVPTVEVQEEVKPVVENIVSQEAKPIYGGSSPAVLDFGIQNDMPRPIYGGANPLENTQSVPIVNDSALVAEEVKPVVGNIVTPEVNVEPVINMEPVIEVPVAPVENVSIETQPVIDSVAIPAVEVPVVEETVTQTDVAPVVETVQQATPVQSLNDVFGNASAESLF